MTTPLLLCRSQIDAQRWDQLIQQSQQRVVYGYSWYLDVVSPGWSALVWPSAEEYQVVMPLPIRKKWGLPVIQQPFFCQYLGLFSAIPLTKDIADAFLRVLDRHFRYISSYTFHPDNTPLLADLLPTYPSIQYQRLHTHWLPLNQPYAGIEGRYSQDRKKNLKRASKAGWTIREQEDIVPLIDMFRTYHAQGIQGGVSEKAYELLKALYRELRKRGLVQVLYAGLGSEPHAGVMLVEEGKRVIYLFNAADQTGRKQNARTYLLDQYLRSHSNLDSVFDFESPEVPSIVDYYRSFGAEKKAFYSIRKNSLPFPLREIQEWRIRQATLSS
ncbi:GNAT family N-acetyltransferase [Telluribacter sp. SYSU D00476]|uniref:GNAT family N-acetyltransferase n=1 Tax=Telluribacter sp. SYSU D00476 TaxID=2811430 RepID=UPI001FF670D5|nr:GNAT family N-acetyltransferase [Telluribacter sp. SYSU D00476]